MAGLASFTLFLLPTFTPIMIPAPPPLQGVPRATSQEHSNDTNLSKINNAFQEKATIYLPVNFLKASSLIILCDFPSKIPDFGIRSQIFALDDLAYFFNAAITDSAAEIIIITQQFSTLRKLLFPPFPLSRPFHWFSRASSSAPDVIFHLGDDTLSVSLALNEKEFSC